jgi:hypothetical protein
MSDTKTEKTVADELREAAARCREAGAAASPPPWRRDGMTIATGWDTAALAYNGVDAAWIALASPALAEPLAAWLEQAAHDFDVEVEEHRPDCCGDVHEEPGLLHMDGCGGWVTVYRDHGGVPCGCFDHALAVARVLNGTTPQEASVS